jgi:Zn-dependent protease with chaperone function
MEVILLGQEIRWRGYSFKLHPVILLAIILFSAAAAPSSAAMPDIPQAVLNDATPQEVSLGRKGVEEIESNWRVIKDPTLQAKVETIVTRLKPFMGRNLPYDIRIVDQETVNAFSLAGGTMYVTTGMLKFVKTDLELAGVIAHEMAHADRKHVMIQTARNDRMTLLTLAAAILSRGEGAAVIAAGALQVAVMGAYSIDLEMEADSVGIDVLTSAGYNPVGMITLQERLREERLKRAHVDPGIYQTHPEIEERIAAAVKYMEDRSIPVNRKHALGVLRPSVDSEAVPGGLALTIDGSVVWRGFDDAPTRELMERIASELWKILQLETAPYDIRVDGTGPYESLLIMGRTVARADDLPDGTAPLSELREGIHLAVTAARRSHPMADYFM